MAYEQHTHCVNSSDYAPLAPGVIAAATVVIVGFLTGGPVGAVIAVFSGYWALSQVCDYLLGGKLICLVHDQCAIGRVMELEPVGYHKSGFETIDNDYCVDLLLAPHIPQDSRDAIENDRLQGNFMKEQSQSHDSGLPLRI
jgi:hypothetical protein